jgi:hypothetical protein
MTITFEIRTLGSPLWAKGLGKSEYKHTKCQITLHLHHGMFEPSYQQRGIAGHAEHSVLFVALLWVRAGVVLSGYGSELYDAARAGWSRIEIPTTTGQDGTRQERTEVVRLNRPIAQSTLFDVELV